MELKLITITLTVASTSEQPTISLIPGLVNNSNGDQVNDLDAVITNTEDEFIAETDIGPNYYQIMTGFYNECRAAGTYGDVTGTEDAILLSYYIEYHGILVELAYKGGDTEIKTQHNKNAPKSQNLRQVHQYACDPYQQLTGCRFGIYLC